LPTHFRGGGSAVLAGAEEHDLGSLGDRVIPAIDHHLIHAHPSPDDVEIDHHFDPRSR
jgi:hypothetical protein